MCYLHDRPGWQDSVMRLVDVFVDGLCVRDKAEVKKTPTAPQRRPGG